MSRSAVFEFWVQGGQHEEVTTRLIADMANLAPTAPHGDWLAITKQPMDADYVAEVIQISHKAHLVPDEKSVEFWTYRYVHMATRNYAENRWFLPVLEQPVITAVPRATISVTPLDIGSASAKESAVRARFKKQGWEYDKSQVHSLRREWFLYRRQGCRWALDDIAAEFNSRTDAWALEHPNEQLYDPDPKELSASQVGADVKDVADLVGLHLDKFRRKSTGPSAAPFLM